jgi:hypothetical protein
MRASFVIVAVAVLVGPGLAPPVHAAPLDGSAPMLCALNSVVECSRLGDCERTTPEDARVPTFLRINVQQRLLTSVDGTRTSPIAAVQRTNGQLMLQGMQNERVWGAVINEETGRMSATVSEDDGAFVVSGACTAP